MSSERKELIWAIIREGHLAREVDQSVGKPASAVFMFVKKFCET